MSTASAPSEVAPSGAGGARALRLVVLGAVLGVPAALVAALFLALVHDVEHWLWTDLPQRRSGLRRRRGISSSGCPSSGRRS